MEALNRRQVVDRLKRVAMRNFFILYAGKGFFVIKDDNKEATEIFLDSFNSMTSNCVCVFACNSIEGPIYKVL